MTTINTKDAKRICNGVNKHDYVGWQEFAYNRAVIYPLGNDMYIEHRKDSNDCRIRGRDYGYMGKPIKYAIYSENKTYLGLVLEDERVWYKIEE